MLEIKLRPSQRQELGPKGLSYWGIYRGERVSLMQMVKEAPLSAQAAIDLVIRGQAVLDEIDIVNGGKEVVVYMPDSTQSLLNGEVLPSIDEICRHGEKTLAKQHLSRYRGICGQVKALERAGEKPPSNLAIEHLFLDYWLTANTRDWRSRFGFTRKIKGKNYQER